jgi:hypothetical protein
LRLILNCAAVMLLSMMLVEPALAHSGPVRVDASSLSLIALGIAGMMLGIEGGARPALSSSQG